MQTTNKVQCPECLGSGNGRGIESGMGCGICHGYGTVTPEDAKAFLAHKEQLMARRMGRGQRRY